MTEDKLEAAQKYLWQEMQRFNAALPEEKRESAAQLKKNYDASVKELDDYLQNANAVQEKLIEFTAKISLNTLILEALQTSLDQNPNITTLDDAKEAVFSTLCYMNGITEDEPHPPHLVAIREAVDDDLFAIIQQTQKIPDLQHSAALRKSLTGLIAQHPFNAPESIDSEVTTFQESRRQQTKALNRYQSDLMDINNALEDFAKTTIAPSNIFHLNPLYKHVQNRISQIEEFRNGLTRSLKAQDPKLSKFYIHHDVYQNLLEENSDLKNIMGNTDKSDAIFHIQDVDRSFCDFEHTDHPTLQKLGIYQDRLRQRINDSDYVSNDRYRTDPPSLQILESGMKSWKRTIEKLVRDKGGRWDKMGDLSRINVVFKNANTEFSYNDLTHALAKDMGWKLAKAGGLRDKGLRMVETGTVNWNMNLQRTEPPGKKLFAEIKMDDYATHAVEKFTHPLYELNRLLNAGSREVIAGEVAPVQRDQFVAAARNAIERLHDNAAALQLISPDLAKIAQNEFSSLLTLANKGYLPDYVQKLNEAMTASQQVISFAAAKHLASPSMAAMHETMFTQWKGEQTKAAATLMQDAIKNKGNPPHAYYLNRQKSEAISALIENSQARHETFGVGKVTDSPSVGKFTEAHAQNFTDFLTEWGDKMKTPKQSQQK